jgi:L-iditol 2-dehydrogenase
MKAIVLTGIRKMKLVDAPEPRIRRGTDVLLKVTAVGICGSDIHYYSNGCIGSQVVKFPFRIGHECSARVIEVGKAVKRVKPGDRVAVDPAVSCGKCDQCRARRGHTCRKLTFLGTPGQGEGCLCEYIVMPETSCFPVRRGISDEIACLVEPLSIGYYSVKLGGDLRKKNIAILGAGPIGLSVLLAARAAGVGRIYVTDKVSARLRAAGKHGATWTGSPDKDDVVRDILRKEPLQFDAVFECCGRQEAVDQGLELLKPGGKLLLVGIPEVERLTFRIDVARRRELVFQNVRRQNECVGPALKLIENGSIKPGFMVTHRFTLENAAKGFDLVESYRDGVIKAMVVP